MSLYHEAAQILTTATENGGSLKSIVFGKKDWKTDRKTLFALSTEAAKWSQVLSEVIENSEVLKTEKQLTPILSVVLTHDLLLSKRGVALPAKHGLHASIGRYKARLTSELTKARLRRGCASLELLREHVNGKASATQADASGYLHPRWIRINLIKTTLQAELDELFSDCTHTTTLEDITYPKGDKNRKLVYIDPNVPNLVAVSGTQEFSSHVAYKEGRIIFQEKASCFPACLLAPTLIQGDVIDACAAPGNKTTHLAAMLYQLGEGKQHSLDRNVFACEKDAGRSETLKKMTKLAGAGDVVQIKAKQDFMRLHPDAAEFANVQALLLDPSCSGSGIVGRDEAKVTIHLPAQDTTKQQDQPRGKKRKRAQPAQIKLDNEPAANTAAEEESPVDAESEDNSKLATRLANLSSFQLRLLERAMSFPSARRISYSTCSLHNEENERVVARALLSDVAKDRGWRILRRPEQVEGMRSWKLRGNSEAVHEVEGSGRLNVQNVADGCIRCEKGGEGGTMGFFVAGFVRDEAYANSRGDGEVNGQGRSNGHAQDAADEGDDEWAGFSDSDG